MLRKNIDIFTLRLCGVLLLGMLLLPACNLPVAQPAAPTAGVDAAPPAPILDTAAPAVEPVQAQAEAGAQGPALTMNLNGVAQGFTSQVIAAVPADSGGPYWEILPQYTVLDLAGYPLTGHMMKAQLFIYPLNDLTATNEGAAKIVADLQALLQNQQAGQNLPFMPLFNAAQVMHAQVKYQDFTNGKSVCYLTQFDQAPVPINNSELIYTCQGLTNDGKYYLAAVLPVSLAGLPAGNQVTGQEPPEFSSDFPTYLNNVVAMLNQQPANAFNPDLSLLDGMIQSIEIK